MCIRDRGPGDDLGGAPQVFQQHAFVVALGVRFQHGARSGAVDHAGNAGLGIQAHVGVERRAHGGDGFAEQVLAVLANGLDQRLVAGQRPHGVGQQQALDLDADAGRGGRGLFRCV